VGIKIIDTEFVKWTFFFVLLFGFSSISFLESEETVIEDKD
jgi:hypothetical protein